MYRHGDRKTNIYRQIKILTDKLANSHTQTDRHTDRQTYTKGPRDGQIDSDIHIRGH